MAPGEELALDFSPRDSIFLGQGTVSQGGVTAPWNWHFVRTNFPAAWDITRGSSTVKVAVIDSEFDTEHDELKTKLATGKNFDSGTAEYLTTNVRATTVNGLHGSHVAGIVAAQTDNGFGTSGACFDCVVIPYKVGVSSSIGGAPNVDAKFVADLTEALVEASKSDAAVINMSLGTPRDHAPVRDAIAVARAAGKVVVASAGNSQLQQPGVVNYPAAYDGVIAVASTRPDDTVAPTSTNGNFVDIAAPGEPVLSTWDSRIPPGSAADIAPTHGQGYRVLGGTSMASPLVAGLAALMRTVRPDLSPDEVEGLLKQSSVDLGAAGPDPVFGAGRIDALKAVQAAQAYVRPVATPPVALRRVRFVVNCRIGKRKVPVARRKFLAAPRGARVICKGRTLPALRRTNLEVQRFVARKGWKRVGRVRTNNKGRFGYSRKLTTLGNWRVRVAFNGNAVLAPAGSKDYKLRSVRRRR
jgi:subtilisin family serine protease